MADINDLVKFDFLTDVVSNFITSEKNSKFETETILLGNKDEGNFTSISIDKIKNLVLDAKSIVLNQDPNNISFFTPSASRSRGDIANVKYIATVYPGDISSSLPVLNGPSQAVKVYRIAYYSSNPALSNSTELVSGSMFIPDNITKTSIIEAGRGATISTSDQDSCDWLSITSNKWVGQTPAQRSINLSSLSARVNLSSLGYVVIASDGFGLGLSLNRVNLFNDYFGNINPSVDIIRAFKKYLEYTKSNGSNLFQNKFNSSILDIFHIGYSRGGLIGTGVANELRPGVSATIPVEEAKQFNSRKIILGATPMPQYYYDWLAENASNPLTRYLNPTIAQLNALLLSGQTSAYSYLTKNFVSNILPLFTDDVTQSYNEFLFGDTNIFKRYKHDYYSNLSDMLKNGILPPVDIQVGPGLNAVAIDWKQVIQDVDSIKAVRNIISNNLPLNSKNRNLKELENIPIIHIYSMQDELCVPPGTGIDMSADMANSNLGQDINGPLDANGKPVIVFKGANKISEYVKVKGGDLESERKMVQDAVKISSNQFINFAVDATAYGSSLNGHVGFNAIWFNYVHSILKNEL